MFVEHDWRAHVAPRVGGLVGCVGFRVWLDAPKPCAASDASVAKLTAAIDLSLQRRSNLRHRFEFATAQQGARTRTMFVEHDWCARSKISSWASV